MIVVMFSGGITSFEVLRRVQASGQPFRALFADTLIEDEDNYRFMVDVERVLGVTIERVADGRDPWGVFKDKRFIGKNGVGICSDILKFRQCLKWLRQNEPAAVVALGFDWTEPHRIDGDPDRGILGARKRWANVGFQTTFPLADPPLRMKPDYFEEAHKLGIKPPRMYALQFEHANCGGACVKGGQAQWAHLLSVMPERYAEHEAKEREMREYLGKDVAILRDRRGGSTKPLTLEALRLRIESGEKPEDDLFSCTCMEE